MSEWRFFGGSQIFIWRKMMVAHFNVWNGAFWGLLLEAKCAVQGTGKLASVLLVNEALRCDNANLWSYIYIYIVDHSGVSGVWMDQVSYFRILFHHTTLLFWSFNDIQWVRANLWTPQNAVPTAHTKILTTWRVALLKIKPMSMGSSPGSGDLPIAMAAMPPNPAKTNEAFVSKEFPNLWTYKLKMISKKIQTMYIINTY